MTETSPIVCFNGTATGSAMRGPAAELGARALQVFANVTLCTASHDHPSDCRLRCATTAERGGNAMRAWCPVSDMENWLDRIIDEK